MVFLVALLSLLGMVTSVVIVDELIDAPEGYEDETGFNAVDDLPSRGRPLTGK